jgi:curved DNA-binding protein CbpA
MKTKSFYLSVLEITNQNPEEKEIKSQYRKLCKIYHTDNQKTGNHEKFLMIEEAKEALLTGKFEKDSQTYFTPPDFLNFANDKISSFLNTAGKNIKIKKLKNKRKLIYHKIDDNIILVIDLTKLTKNKSIVINKQIINFIVD